MKHEQFPIDFVMPWVDDTDPEWRKQYNYYKGIEPDETDGQAVERFRNWDNLQYWFRGVEKYAPWVNKVFLVTCGQCPEWLNTKHPKLVLVEHKDYIPQKYLPVFSANPIEVNLHRIEGLSENFVYFNDDIFILKPLAPEDFFVNGKPREMAVEFPLHDSGGGSFSHMLMNNTGLLNAHFQKCDVIKSNLWKWFNPVYGKYLLNNICMYRFGVFSDIVLPHFPSPMRKSKMAEVWNVAGDAFELTCSHRFRSAEDVNQYVFRLWNMATGDFKPTNLDHYAKSLLVEESRLEAIKAMIKNQKTKMLCINDSKHIKDFNMVRNEINKTLETVFPQKSGFER